MKRSFRVITAFVMVFLLAVSMLTACGNKIDDPAVMSIDYNDAVSSQNKMVSAAQSGITMMETAAAASAWDTGASSEEERYDSAVPVPEAAQAADGISDLDSEAVVNTLRKLIRTVDLRVETTDFDSLIAGITQFVSDCGGYIERSDVSGNSASGSGRRYASVTARIPADQVDTFLSRMDQQSNVTYRSENVQDVTLQYTDIESRKKSLTIEQERLWELLEKADSLDAVISLEERLSEIRYELERMESQLRTYDNQVDYSTVYIDINEVGVFTPVEPDSVLTRIQKGFMRNLQDVENGFVDIFVWFASSLPTLIVLAVFVGIIALIIRAIVRRTGRKDKLASGPLKAKDKKTASGASTQAIPEETAPKAEVEESQPADNKE